MNNTRYYKCCKCGARLECPEGVAPGDCGCGATHPYPWLTRFTPWPRDEPGYVIVHSIHGSQELLAPHYQVNPAAWKPYNKVSR